MTKWLWIGSTAYNLDYIRFIQGVSEDEVYFATLMDGKWEYVTFTDDRATAIIKWLNESDEVHSIA